MIAYISYEKTFTLDNKDKEPVKVVATFYKTPSKYNITLWLNGVEEIITASYDNPSFETEHIEYRMKALLDKHTDYILDIANWKEE